MFFKTFQLYLFAFALLLTSCASIPKQTYLNKTSFSGTSRAVVTVSVTTPKVTHALNNPHLGWPLFSWLAGYGFTRATLVNAAAEDAESGDAIEKHIDIKNIEENLGNTFSQLVSKSNHFQAIDYITDKSPNNNKLLSAGYNMLIRLSVSEISIRSTTVDHVKLHILMHGEMEDLATKSMVWDRDEKISSSEMELLENMKDKGPKYLNTMLEKAVKYLANDFIYLK